MVITGTWDERSVTISVKPNCLTVSLATGAAADVFSYDYAGRLWTAMLAGVSYRRGLDGKMVAKWTTPDGGRSRRWVLQEDALQVEARARERTAGLLDAVRAGTARLDAPLPREGAAGFAQALAFTAEASRADAARYRQVYKPVGILPPDQYMAVVLQATEGCSFNTCTFCNFYRDRPFRVKSPDEFRAHAEAVRDFLGAGLSLRRTIFLGDANALAVPMPRLQALLEATHAVYDVAGLGGVYAFLDGFSGERKSAGDYRTLARLGLERVYIGLESGHEPLLRFLRKPGTAADAVRAVRALKAGGVAVGVIVLLGAGGRQFAAAHVRDTIQSINAMGLDLDDLVYFSELIESEGLPYVQDAYRAELQPLEPEERLAQGESIERGLRFSRQGGTPHISRYDIREFVY